MNRRDTDRHDFLVFDYADAGFMLNRNQFVSGISIIGECPFESPFEHIVSSVGFKKSRVAVFDLDAFLANAFQRKREHAVKVGLISDLSTFTDSNRSVYEAFARRLDVTISTALLAVKVGGHARIARYRFADIRLLPPGLRKKQNGTGILGCRFSGGTVRFFLDVETIIAKLLARDDETEGTGVRGLPWGCEHLNLAHGRP